MRDLAFQDGIENRKKKILESLFILMAVLVCSLYYFKVQMGLLPNTDEVANFARFNMISTGRMGYKVGNILWDISSYMVYLVCGYSYDAVRVNNTIMYAIIIWLSLKIIMLNRPEGCLKSRCFFLPVFIYLVGIVHEGKSKYYGILGDGIYMYPLNHHCTAIIFALLCFYLILICEKKENYTIFNKICIISVMLYGILWTDSVFLVICVIPSIIYFGRSVLSKCVINGKYKVYSVIILMAFVTLNVLAFYIPQLSFLHQESMNQYRDGLYGISNFGGIESAVARINTYICGLFGIFNCIFFNNAILNIKNFSYLIRLIMLVLCICVDFALLYRSIKKRENDIFLLFVYAKILLSFAFLMADFGAMYINERYLGALLYFSVIILFCRINIFRRLARVINKNNTMIIVWTILLILLFANPVVDKPLLKYDEELDALAEIISEKQLGNGISSYWISYNLSTKLGGDYYVDPVDYKEGVFEKSINTSLPMQVDQYNYIVVAKEGDNYSYTNNIDDEMINLLYGEYDDVIRLKYFELYYYKDGIELGVGGITPQTDVMYPGNGAAIEDESFVLENNDFIYGPYVNLEEGVYEVSIGTEKVDNVALKITADSGKVSIPYEVISKEKDAIKCKFALYEDMEAIEFLVSNPSNTTIKINYILYKKTHESIKQYLGNKEYTPNELLKYSSEIIEGENYIGIRKGGLIWGPYIPLTEGEYIVSVSGENVDKASISLQSDLGKNVFEYEIIQQSKDLLDMKVLISESVDDFEVVISNGFSDIIKLEYLRIKCSE